jgi:tripartite-type tricarboxylate transporter receptor subunit TctC
MAVSPVSPIKSLKELVVEQAKNPADYTIGGVGAASTGAAR